MLHTKYWKTKHIHKTYEGLLWKTKKEKYVRTSTRTKVSTTAWLTKLTHEITEVWTPNLNRWSLQNDLF